MSSDEKPAGPIKPVVANAHYATEYGDSFKKSQETGICIFCAEFEKNDPNIVLHRSGGWWAKKNPFPPKGRNIKTPAKKALLIMPTRHVSEMSELGPNDWMEIGKIFDYVTAKEHITGGGLCVRFGDPKLSGRTLLHLHFQLIVPDLEFSSENIDPVDFPIG